MKLRIYFFIVAALLAGPGCNPPAPPRDPVTPPDVTHALPQEDYNEMCVVCHTCGTGDAPVITQQHDVCNSCHLPDGSVDIHGDDPCAWEMNCDTTPPQVNCNQCHTVAWVNDLCLECHVQASAVLECTYDIECGPGEICFVGDCRDGCRADDDRCPDGYHCNNGTCRADEQSCTDTDECRTDVDCKGDAVCLDCMCVEVERCPAGMQLVQGVCIDMHEASRPDATAASAGVAGGAAQSVAGVLPWTNVSWADARNACLLAGKRLCTTQEWIATCQGSQGTLYSYGDDYDPSICNGIDTFCDCSSEDCAEGPCPYPYCFQDCGASYQRLPTGTMDSCVSEGGLYDMSGNVWEFDASGTGRVHGGAYNCIDSLALHQCTRLTMFGTEARSNVGFRCCSDPD